MTSTLRLLAPCLAGCLVLVASGCEKPPVAETAEIVRPVKMFRVGGSDAPERSYPGRVAAADRVDLSFRVGGPLIELPIVEGQQIARGEVLAVIDPRDFEIQLASALARYEQAQADFNRTSALYEKDAVSKAELDQARAARDMAKAGLDDAEAALGDSRLRAPFGGLVGEIFVDNFQDVQPRERILSLVAVDRLEIEVDLPESVVAQLREGDPQQARIAARFATAPGREFELKLTELAAQADPRTQTYRATFRMPQPEGVNILPGMTANVFGQGPKDRAELLIPAIAVVSGPAGESQVWIVDSDTMTVHRRSVTTGSFSGSEQIEIVHGLEPGETVVTSAMGRLREGMQVSGWNR